ncbi:MAG: prolyl-tRNA synthetase associated domain-containing protein [Oscillospiraceae bacterium]|nr:prolyl-tRNA synthetase associated domain-containing protein [Oscillospiraceae bacterium]
MTTDNLSRRAKTLAKLDEIGVEYTMTEHPAVYTIEEMDNLGITQQGLVCKNLFLRDAKGKRHFLVVLHKDKQADLNRLKELLDSTRLSFASADRLMRILGLTQGEVTPLGVLNDERAQAEVVLDADIVGQPCLGVHPNENTATVWISYQDLYKVLNRSGSRVVVLKL